MQHDPTRFEKYCFDEREASDPVVLLRWRAIWVALNDKAAVMDDLRLERKDFYQYDHKGCDNEESNSKHDRQLLWSGTLDPTNGLTVAPSFNGTMAA